MTRLKSVALFAVAAALSSPVLAQDDPNQSAVKISPTPALPICPA